MIRQVAVLLMAVAISANAQSVLDPIGATNTGGAGYGLGGLGGLNGYGINGIGGQYGVNGIVAQLQALGPYGRVLASQLITNHHALLAGGNGLIGAGFGGRALAGGLNGLYKK